MICLSGTRFSPRTRKPRRDFTSDVYARFPIQTLYSARTICFRRGFRSGWMVSLSRGEVTVVAESSVVVSFAFFCWRRDFLEGGVGREMSISSCVSSTCFFNFLEERSVVGFSRFRFLAFCSASLEDSFLATSFSFSCSSEVGFSCFRFFTFLSTSLEVSLITTLFLLSCSSFPGFFSFSFFPSFPSDFDLRFFLRYFLHESKFFAPRTRFVDPLILSSILSSQIHTPDIKWPASLMLT